MYKMLIYKKKNIKFFNSVSHLLTFQALIFILQKQYVYRMITKCL